MSTRPSKMRRSGAHLSFTGRQGNGKKAANPYCNPSCPVKQELVAITIA